MANCSKCGGTGKLITSGGLGPNKTCDKCNGTGKA
jgi:DnaJ-class molecular chaperone